MVDKKFYIFNSFDEPLCWEEDDWDSDKAIAFESYEEAEEFVSLIKEHYPDAYGDCVEIYDCIFFYDGGTVPGMLAKELFLKEIKKEN